MPRGDKRTEELKEHAPYRLRPGPEAPLPPSTLKELAQEPRTSFYSFQVESTGGHMWAGLYGGRGADLPPILLWSRTYVRPEGVSEERCFEVAVNQLVALCRARGVDLPK